MGSPKESSRPRKFAELPSWAQESVVSTEQLMSSFYSTQEPLTSPDSKLEKVTSAVSEPAVNQNPGGSIDYRGTNLEPIKIALADEQPDEVVPHEEVPDVSSSNAPPRALHVEHNDRVETAVGKGTVERGERSPRTRASLSRRKSSSSALEQRWNTSMLSIGALDSALVELLPGKSSALYKAFYQRTHGSEPSVKEIRATKQLLSSWSGIANRNTLIKHIQHLVAIRLIKRTMAIGDTDGPLYTVRRLEDVGISKEVAEAFYRQIFGMRSGVDDIQSEAQSLVTAGS